MIAIGRLILRLLILRLGLVGDRLCLRLSYQVIVLRLLPAGLRI